MTPRRAHRLRERADLHFAASALLIAAVAALVSGIPTDVVPNPWFTRMTAVSPADRILLVASSLMVGIALAPVAGPNRPGRRGVRNLGVGSGVASWLAIGCPICNKLVIALLGVSGALNLFGPVQPLLGLLSVAVGVTAVFLKFRVPAKACEVTPPGQTLRLRPRQP